MIPLTPGKDSTSVNTTRNRLPLRFVLLLFALSIPFWLMGQWTGLQFMPGIPVASLGFVTPVIAASILVYRQNNIAGVIELLQRSFDYKRIGAIWYIPIVLLMPGTTVVSYGLMRMMGYALQPPSFSVLAGVAMFVVFFIAALGEELGWSGYATDPLQVQWSAIKTGIGLGLIWAAWHWVPLAQAHRPARWIAWWSLYTVALRVLIVWLYNNTGKSVFAAALFHAMTNVTGITFSGYYDPRITGLIVAFTATLVTAIWGPRTLSRYSRL